MRKEHASRCPAKEDLPADHSLGFFHPDRIHCSSNTSPNLSYFNSDHADPIVQLRRPCERAPFHLISKHHTGN